MNPSQRAAVEEAVAILRDARTLLAEGWGQRVSASPFDLEEAYALERLIQQAQRGVDGDS